MALFVRKIYIRAPISLAAWAWCIWGGQSAHSVEYVLKVLLLSRHELPFGVKNRATTNFTGCLPTVVSHDHLFLTLADSFQAVLLHPCVDDFDPMIIDNLLHVTISLFYMIHFAFENSPRVASDTPAANSKELGDFSIKGFRGCYGTPAVDNVALLVDQEFFKVPL